MTKLGNSVANLISQNNSSLIICLETVLKNVKKCLSNLV